MKICKVHNVELQEKTGKFGKFYSHWDAENEAWCNPKKGQVIEGSENKGSVDEQRVDWDAKDRASYAQTAYNVGGNVVAALVQVRKDQISGELAVKEVEEMAKRIYVGILKARKGEWNGL